MKARTALSGFLLAGTILSGTAQANLVTNGDFSLGNIGFSSQYRYVDTGNPSEGVYTIATDPRALHSGATGYGDHTSGTGNMMVANGATGANVTVWEQTVVVTADTDYVLSGWAASWGNYGDGIDTSPARLQLFANGSQVGSEFTVEETNGVWSQFYVSLNTGSVTSLTLTIIDANQAYAPNDFSLDDISLSIAPDPISVPEPGTLALYALGLFGLALSRWFHIVGCPIASEFVQKQKNA